MKCHGTGTPLSGKDHFVYSCLAFFCDDEMCLLVKKAHTFKFHYTGEGALSVEESHDILQRIIIG